MPRSKRPLSLGLWTDEQTALILLYVDHCRTHAMDFQKTVVGAHSTACKVDRNWNSIYSRLARLFHKHKSEDAGFMAEALRHRGSECMDLPPNLKEAMTKHRNSWNMSTLAGLPTAVHDPAGGLKGANEDNKGITKTKSALTPFRAEKGSMTCKSGDNGGSEYNPGPPLTTAIQSQAVHAENIDVVVLGTRQSSEERSSKTIPDGNEMEVEANDKRYKTRGKASTKSANVHRDSRVEKRPNHKRESKSTRNGLQKRKSTRIQEVSTMKKAKLSTSQPTIVLEWPTAPTQQPSDLTTASKKGMAHLNHIPNSADRQVTAPDGPDERDPVKNQSVPEMQLMWDVVIWLTSQTLAGEEELPKGLNEKLSLLRKQLVEDPTNAVGTLLKKVAEANQMKLRCQETAIQILGQNSYNNNNETFQGKSLREGIQQAVGYTSEAPMTPRAQGFLEAKVDELIFGNVDDDKLDEWLKGCKDCLEQPHGIQILLGTLVCRWIFASPDPMHPEIRGKVLLGLYKVEAELYGLKHVQNMDKIAMKAQFLDPEWEALSKPLQTRLIHRFTKFTKEFCKYKTPVTEQFDPEDWIHHAVKLRRKLMIGPKDYRIVFCPSGTVFNPKWMKAENVHRDVILPKKAKKKLVMQCLFPALMEQDAETLDEGAGIAAALVSNKRFFPSCEEKGSFDPKRTVSKAIVTLA